MTLLVDCWALATSSKYSCNASLEVCEARDPKGLYGRYRRGEISGISGIDDPYESPLTAELVLDTASCTVDDSVTTILTYLTGRREGSST